MAHFVITGATGFVGNALALELLNNGHFVYWTGRANENPLPPHNTMYLCENFAQIEWSLLEPVRAVFHLAACADTTVTDWDYVFTVNCAQSAQLFMRAAIHGVRNIVAASSAAIYGTAATKPMTEYDEPFPANLYAESKLHMERLAEQISGEYGIPIVCLRFSNVYGAGESHKGKTASMVFRLLEQIRRGNPTLFEFGEQRRDWVYVRDVVRALLLASGASRYDVFNVGSGVATSFNDVVALWCDLLSVNRVTQYVKNPFAQQYQAFTCLDLAHAVRGLEYRPRFSLVEGMSEMWREIQAMEQRKNPPSGG